MKFGEGMKKLFIFAFCFLLFNFLNSLGTLRVESIKELPETHMNLEVRDADGKYAPVLIVKTELKGIGFQNVSRPTKQAAQYIEGDHHYKFYMNDNQRVIKITHSDYEPLEIRFLADYGINIDTQRMYELILKVNDKVNYCEVNIKTIPANAKLYINNKIFKIGQIQMQDGEYNIRIEKAGFETIERVIRVEGDKNYYDFTMKEKTKPSFQQNDNINNVFTKIDFKKQIIILLISPPIISMVIALLKKYKFIKIINWGCVFFLFWILYLILLSFIFPDLKILISVFESHLKLL